MGQITKVTPDMIQVANNVTSTTIGNTTSGISLTFDSNGVITSAANVVLSVANTQLTGTITNAQLGTDAVSNTKIAAGAVEQYFADTGFEAQFRNRIINGDMRIDQRNAGASVAVDAASEFAVDRFTTNYSTGIGATLSIQQVTDAPVGFVNSYKLTVTSGAAASGIEVAALWHTIEGTNVSDLAWGTADAKTVSLSFWVKSSLTGTFGGSLLNNARDRSYPFAYEIAVADTWEYKTITIPGDISGTWLTDNGVGIYVNFGWGTGPDRLGTAGAWVGARVQGVTGETSIISNTGATWQVTGVQLEAGSVATPFERRPYGTELALCQRYYYKIAGGGFLRFASGFVIDSTRADFVFSFPVSMRVAPTALEQSGTAAHYSMLHRATSTACSSVPIYQDGTSNTGNFRFTVASGLTAGDAAIARFGSSADGYLAYSAEL
jgi:hypothetical protein